jgi:mono/diheme cytochrome c family protein
MSGARPRQVRLIGSPRAKKGVALVVAALVAASAACKPETSLEAYPCPAGGTALTYDSFGRDYLATNCQTCHGQASADRQGAPPGYDFGTLAQARAQKARIFARAAADNTTMPPGPDDPPLVERNKLAEWLACGAP